MKYIFSLLVATFILFSCEEKPVVIPEFVPIDTGKTVYVEELTGVKCPNCPAGSARLETILLDYPDNMIVVGIHGIDLASPISGASKYDFRNEDAADLEIFLKDFLGKPSAYFNRVRFEEFGEIWGNPAVGQWASFVEQELEKPQVMEVSIIKSYNEDTRELEVTVAVLPLEDLSGEFKVTLLLTESEIVDAQEDKDQSEIVLDYVHNHVLRDVITMFNGDAFANSLTKDEGVSKTYVYTIPNDVEGLWKPEHLEIVAFIANTEGESEEVLQAASEHVLD